RSRRWLILPRLREKAIEIRRSSCRFLSRSLNRNRSPLGRYFGWWALSFLAGWRCSRLSAFRQTSAVDGSALRHIENQFRPPWREPAPYQQQQDCKGHNSRLPGKQRFPAARPLRECLLRTPISKLLPLRSSRLPVNLGAIRLLRLLSQCSSLTQAST